MKLPKHKKMKRSDLTVMIKNSSTHFYIASCIWFKTAGGGGFIHNSSADERYGYFYTANLYQRVLKHYSFCVLNSLSNAGLK